MSQALGITAILISVMTLRLVAGGPSRAALRASLITSSIGIALFLIMAVTTDTALLVVLSVLAACLHAGVVGSAVRMLLAKTA